MPIVRLSVDKPAGGGLGKQEAIQLYREYFLPHTTASAGWTGDYASCNAGTLSPAFTDAVLKLVNYFRIAAGVPEVRFDAGLSAKSQQAALMYSVNRALSHDPPHSWRCYTSGGAEAAGSSNASIFYSTSGDADVAGIRGQMEDMGGNNVEVGHRRWILLSTTSVMGMGHVPSNMPAYPAAGALWVLPTSASAASGASVTTREPFVAWPPAGYVPWQSLYLATRSYYESNPVESRLRWSLQLWGADFGSASVSVTLDGTPIPVQVLARVKEYNQSIVFLPAIDFGWVADGRDHALDVRVSNVKEAGGGRRDFAYTVYIFDAGS